MFLLSYSLSYLGRNHIYVVLLLVCLYARQCADLILSIGERLNKMGEEAQSERQKN